MLRPYGESGKMWFHVELQLPPHYHMVDLHYNTYTPAVTVQICLPACLTLHLTYTHCILSADLLPTDSNLGGGSAL